MKGERAVALDKYEEPDRRPQAHDQSPTDSCGIQSSWIGHEWQNANDCQYKDDDPASPKMPAVHLLQVKPVFVDTHKDSTHRLTCLRNLLSLCDVQSTRGPTDRMLFMQIW